MIIKRTIRAARAASDGHAMQPGHEPRTRYALLAVDIPSLLFFSVFFLVLFYIFFCFCLPQIDFRQSSNVRNGCRLETPAAICC